MNEWMNWNDSDIVKSPRDYYRQDKLIEWNSTQEMAHYYSRGLSSVSLVGLWILHALILVTS